MPRVRWADLGLDDAAEDPPEVIEDAWGPEEAPQSADEAPDAHQPARAVSQAQQAALAALLAAAQRQPQQQQPQQQPKQMRLQQQKQAPPKLPQQQPQKHQVPSLHKLCMGVLGQHVTALVEDLGDQLQWLPPDVRAALLAVARRRGEMTGLVLSSLADDSWLHLDLAGCSKLYGAELLAAAPRMPRLTALDLTGCERISAGGWRQLAQLLPQLQVVRLGGTSICSKEALKALPHILPGVPPPPHKAAAAAAAASSNAPAAPAADSWEDAFASSDSEEEQDDLSAVPAAAAGNRRSSSSGSSNEQHPGGSSSSSGRLRHLQALIWPDVPSAAVELVQQRCPRVLINPALEPDKFTGQLPPREWHPEALDEPFMALVTPAALETASYEDVAAMAAAAAAGQGRQQEPVVHIAERFRQAYIDRARRLKEKERRLQAAEQRKQLKASHALRTLDVWLDERA